MNQLIFANKLNNIDKNIKSVEKMLFLSNIRLFFTTREKVLNNSKSRLFPIKKSRTATGTRNRT